MNSQKRATVPMTIRIGEDVHTALLAACDAEHRSKANMIEFLIIDYCRRHEIPYPAQRTAVTARKK